MINRLYRNYNLARVRLVFLILTGFTFSGCVGLRGSSGSVPSGFTFNKFGEYRIGAGDELSVKVDGHENLEGNFKYMGIGVFRNNEGKFYLTQLFVLAP